MKKTGVNERLDAELKELRKKLELRESKRHLVQTSHRQGEGSEPAARENDGTQISRREGARATKRTQLAENDEAANKINDK